MQSLFRIIVMAARLGLLSIEMVKLCLIYLVVGHKFIFGSGCYVECKIMQQGVYLLTYKKFNYSHFFYVFHLRELKPVRIFHVFSYSKVVVFM